MGYLFGVYEIRENMVNHHKMINAAIATLATCAMLLPVVGSANANESSNTAVLGAGYTATKISHPNAGLGEDDGIVNVLNGESIDDLTQGLPERGQNYSWASAGYGDWMYVGTCYSAMGSTLKYMANTMGAKYASIKAALDVAFNGELFLDNGENHSLLLKINVKTGDVKIIGNLPYYITTPIIMHILENSIHAESITVMMQKEVADRIKASPGNKTYGAISAAVQYYCEVEQVISVPKEVFVPRPKVDSAVLKLTIRKETPVDLIDEKAFFACIKAGFGQRRKTLLNSLTGTYGLSKDEIRTILEKAGIDPVRRAETLDMNEFADIANGVASAKQTI